jgi:hypothetical protein
MSIAMTKKEREAFLAEVHVGVLAISESGRGPLAVPVWYAYEPGGELRFVTARGSRKGKLITQAARLSLCAQTETAPYKYVSVEGPIVGRDASDVERDLRPIARRYLGPQGGDAYVDGTRGEHGDDMLVRLRPERWLTVDFAKGGG